MFSDVCVPFAATFDIQNSTAEGGSKISMTGGFISNSSAMGCFLVLQCDNGSPDEFRVLLRNFLESIVDAEVDAPSSIYIMYMFDVEMNGDINPNPALINSTQTNVTRGKFF